MFKLDDFKNNSKEDNLGMILFIIGIIFLLITTYTGLTKMGLWFTKAEENELKVAGNSNTDRLKYAKERLHLPSKLILRFSEKGLSYHEMRAILILPKKQKYTDMTTEQLLTLRNKILPRLLKEVDSHIFNWKRLMKQIEIVARSKNIDLND